MNQTKYRIVQTSELNYEVQIWKHVAYDPLDHESIYEWVKIEEFSGSNGFYLAKNSIETLVKNSGFPKIVYETEIMRKAEI